jgi:hypothetical protein
MLPEAADLPSTHLKDWPLAQMSLPKSQDWPQLSPEWVLVRAL